MCPFQHLFDLNARLVAALDVPARTAVDADALDALLGARAALLEGLQQAGEKAPAALLPLLRAQHARVETLLNQRASETRESLARLDRYAHAQARYAPATGRQVLRSGLDV